MSESTNAAPAAAASVDRPAEPRFDLEVTPGGYLWWYVDGFTPDGAHGITLIAMLGSVFSPYYAWAGRRDPLDHMALNVAVYGDAGKRWALTERRRGALDRSARHLRLGPSALDWDGTRLRVTIDERGAPLPWPIRGEVVLTPTAVSGRAFALDAAGRHRWWPIAPSAHIAVDLERPQRRWEGIGYLDTNHGEAPLEADFRRWDWSRVHADGEGFIVYEATRRDGGDSLLALHCHADGRIEDAAPPPRVKLPTTGWRVARGTRDAAPERVRVRRDWEDTPFYARALLDSTHAGRPALAMHESLDLDRFASPWVRLLLPFRMPRTLR